MHPILLDFELWGRRLTIHAYASGIVLSIATVALLGWLTAVRRRLPGWPSFAYCAAIALAMPVGSRLFYWASHPELQQSEPNLLTRADFGGFYMSGGLIAALLVSFVACRLLRLNDWRMLDAAAPALGIGGAILRIGCFLNGCCFGNPTSLPWGVTFPIGSPAHRHQVGEQFDLLFREPLPVHPTQLYEMAACLLAATIALLLHRRRVPDGVPALTACLWFLFFRWFERYLRADGQSNIGPSCLPAVAYATALAICVLAALARYRTEPDRRHPI